MRIEPTSPRTRTNSNPRVRWLPVTQGSLYQRGVLKPLDQSYLRCDVRGFSGPWRLESKVKLCGGSFPVYVPWLLVSNHSTHYPSWPVLFAYVNSAEGPWCTCLVFELAHHEKRASSYDSGTSSRILDWGIQATMLYIRVQTAYQDPSCHLRDEQTLQSAYGDARTLLTPWACPKSAY